MNVDFKFNMHIVIFIPFSLKFVFIKVIKGKHYESSINESRIKHK